MKVAKAISLLGLIAMTVVLIYGFTVGNFREDGAALLSNPWGIVSLVDLYVGFILSVSTIKTTFELFHAAFVWVFLMMVLGFFTGALYTFIALQTSGGDWRRFFLGSRAYRNDV